MKHTITQYDTSHQGKFDPSWYADVWASDTALKMQVKGMPFDSVFHMDRKAIPQLIGILQRIQNDAKIHS